MSPSAYIIREDTDTLAMSGSVTPAEAPRQLCLEQITNPWMQFNKVFICLSKDNKINDKQKLDPAGLSRGNVGSFI